MQVLIVDDHPLVARAMADLARRLAPGLSVRTAGTLADAEVALQSSFVFDAVLLDLMIPGGDGPTSVQKLLRLAPDARFVIVSGIDDPMVMRACWDAGAVGYVRKGDPEQVQAQALSDVLLHGGVAFPPEALDARSSTAPTERLTPREREVLDALVRTGQGNKALARHLSVDPATIKSHVTSILRKTGARTRTELIAQSRATWPRLA